MAESEIKAPFQIIRTPNGTGETLVEILSDGEKRILCSDRNDMTIDKLLGLVSYGYFTCLLESKRGGIG